MKGGLYHMNSSTIYLIKTVIFFLTLSPFLLELIAFICILRYRKYSINISKNTNDFFRAIKLRYTNSTKLEIPIRSSRSFIEKVLLGKDGLMSYIFVLDRFSLFISFICLGCTSIFTIKGHINFTYLITTLVISFYLFRQACALEIHLEFIISMTEDYLDNTLYHRVKPINEQELSIPSLKKRSKNIENKFQTNNTKNSPTDVASSESMSNTDTSAEPSVPAATNHIIESILHEFLN